MDNIKRLVWGFIEDRADKQVFDQVNIPVRNIVYIQTDAAVWSQVRTQVFDEIWGQVKDQIEGII